MRTIRGLSILSIILPLIVFLGACAPSLGTALDVVGFAGAAREVQNAYAMRKEPAPLAGTYEMTIEVGGKEPVTIYGKTYFNKNIPIIELEENEKLQELGIFADRADRAGYMTNLVAFGSLDEVPDTLMTDGMIGGGFLVASAPPVSSASGTLVTPGHIAIRMDTTLAGPLGEIARAYDAAVRDKDLTLESDNFTTYPDGAVSGAVRFVDKSGSAVAVVKYQRISTAAFGLSAEVLENYSVGDVIEGYTGGKQ